MKIHVKLLFLLLIVCLISCSDAPSEAIIGRWERVNDKAEGSIVTVKKLNDTIYEGTITKVQGELLHLGFSRRDVKWQNIKFLTEKEYEAEDLAKGIDKFGKVVRTNYVDISI